MNVGDVIASCRILEKLGEGGMGQVYRARDPKLNRDVAIKVLPDLFASDPDRLARFQREAQVLAALNHPNIAHIHGFEDSNGVRALVMELVEGEDLSQRIARGARPLVRLNPGRTTEGSSLRFQQSSVGGQTRRTHSLRRRAARDNR